MKKISTLFFCAVLLIPAPSQAAQCTVHATITFADASSVTVKDGKATATSTDKSEPQITYLENEIDIVYK